MKLLRVVFSTNRIEYLEKTLKSTKMLDFSGLEVHHLFIDDYPLGRDDEFIKNFAFRNKFNEVILHEKNMGITKTWQQLFEIISDRDYDYILHHEDDVELLQPVKILDLIEILENDKTLSQVQLKRNNWYEFETEPIGPKDTDIIFKNYRYEKTNYFWMLMSLYPSWIAREPILEETGFNPAEYVIEKYLSEKYNLKSACLKTIEGNNMVNHIGEYFQGKRVSENEPGWENFKYIDPSKKYCSKTGVVLK